MSFFYGSGRGRGEKKPHAATSAGYAAARRGQPAGTHPAPLSPASPLPAYRPKFDYCIDRLMKMQDHTMKALRKKVRFEPPSRTPGFYGRTWLGWDEMELRAGLPPDFSYQVDVHESIHTPDEYETRELTAWMLDISAQYARENKERSINYHGNY